MSNNEDVVTVEYLINHGFMPFSEDDDHKPYDVPFDSNEGSINLREIDFHRQMFVVLFTARNGDPKDGWNRNVYVQEDVGCGFVNIPFPWWDLSIEFFESVYYGIRGHKPKFTGLPAEDINYELVQPKQLNQ